MPRIATIDDVDRHIIKLIQAGQDASGKSPNLEEIGREIGGMSAAGVKSRVDRLVRDGYIAQPRKGAHNKLEVVRTPQ